MGQVWTSEKEKVADSEDAEEEVFLSCGNKIADGQQFQHNMELESDIDED